jgi:hypothetical protein
MSSCDHVQLMFVRVRGVVEPLYVMLHAFQLAAEDEHYRCLRDKVASTHVTPRGARYIRGPYRRV